MEGFKMKLEALVAVLFLICVSILAYEIISKKKQSMDRRIKLCSVRIMCMAISTFIQFLATGAAVLLGSYVTLHVIIFFICLIWLFGEVLWQSKLIKQKQIK